ncbi:MAG TPA: hypothetical protein PKX13_12870 [Acidiphilium sp.]|nr:hypothetical protein [Acidiphilium sp.]
MSKALSINSGLSAITIQSPAPPRPLSQPTFPFRTHPPSCFYPPVTNQPTLVSLSLRFAVLMRGLRSAFIGRGNQTGLPRPLLHAIHLRLLRMIARFEYILAHPPAAKPPHVHRPRPNRPYQPSPLPRDHAWLPRLLPARETEIAVCAPHRAAIEHFLADPAMRAVIAQNQALHPLLRGLCHMLGIPRPTHLPPPSHTPRPTPTHPRKPRRRATPPAGTNTRSSPYPPPPRQPTSWDQRQAFYAMFGPPRSQS